MSVSNEFVAINTEFDAFSPSSLQPAQKVKAQMPFSRWDSDIRRPAEKILTNGPARSSKGNGVSRLVIQTHAGYRWEVLPRAFSGEHALDHAARYARTLEHQRYWSRQFDNISQTIKEDRCPDLKIVFLKVFSQGSNRMAYSSANRFPYTSLYAISSVYVDPFNLLGAKFCGTDETTIRSGINGDIFIVIEMEILEALYSTKESIKAQVFNQPVENQCDCVLTFR